VGGGNRGCVRKRRNAARPPSETAVQCHDRATGFDVDALALDRSGLKLFDFHPNIAFANASDEVPHVQSFYHDPERLLAARQHSRGARTLLLDLLAAVRTRSLPMATVGEVNAQRRAAHSAYLSGSP